MIRFIKISGLCLAGLVVLFTLINIIDSQLIDRGYDYFFTNIIRPKCINYKQANFSKKLNNKVPDYIGSSSISGIKKCKDEKQLLERVSQGKLVEIKNGDGFVIEKMSHSYPYLTSDGRDLLLEIGKRFQDKISDTRLRKSRFTITSMTRTTDKLESLRGINANTSANSPHLYGNAFDISYLRFSTRKLFLTYCDKAYLKEALAEVIWQIREENKCWATYEIRQNCFHVVSR